MGLCMRFQSLLLLVLSFNFCVFGLLRLHRETGFNPYYYWSYLLTILNHLQDYNGTTVGFNPYYYWSYLLTYVVKYGYGGKCAISFNPYYYWSYLLTTNNYKIKGSEKR